MFPTVAQCPGPRIGEEPRPQPANPATRHGAPTLRQPVHDVPAFRPGWVAQGEIARFAHPFPGIAELPTFAASAASAASGVPTPQPSPDGLACVGERPSRGGLAWYALPSPENSHRPVQTPAAGAVHAGSGKRKSDCPVDHPPAKRPRCGSASLPAAPGLPADPVHTGSANEPWQIGHAAALGFTCVDVGNGIVELRGKCAAAARTGFMYQHVAIAMTRQQLLRMRDPAELSAKLLEPAVANRLLDRADTIIRELGLKPDSRPARDIELSIQALWKGRSDLPGCLTQTGASGTSPDNIGS